MAVVRIETVGFLPSLHSTDRLSWQQRRRPATTQEVSGWYKEDGNGGVTMKLDASEAKTKATDVRDNGASCTTTTTTSVHETSTSWQRRGSTDGDFGEGWHHKLKHREIALRARRLLGAKSFDDDSFDSEPLGGEILVDDDPHHPIFVRHDPLSEGFVCSWVFKENSRTSQKSWEFASEFVRLPVGQGLKCVRFLRPPCSYNGSNGNSEDSKNSRESKDSKACTDVPFELPTTFAFLYEDYNHRSMVAVKRRVPATATSGECKDSLIHISLVDPKTALATDVELDRPGGYLGRRACNVRVLDMIWQSSSATNWLVVVTVNELDVVEYGSAGTPKLVQTIKLGTVVHHWFERSKGYVLVEVRPVSRLKPFQFKNGRLEQLPDVNLQLLPWQRIVAHSIYLMTLYDQVFCIHCDSANGRVTLKRVSRPSKTEYVAVVFGPGSMVLQKREDLLLLHRPDRAETWVYDLRHTPSLLPSYEEDGYRVVRVAELAPPLRLSRKGTSVLQSVRALDDTQYPAACSFDVSVDGWVIDRSRSVIEVCFLTLDLRAATSILLPLPVFTTKQLVQTLLWLLRRQQAHAELVEVVTAAAAAAEQSHTAEPWVSAVDVCTGTMRYAATKQRKCTRQQWLNNLPADKEAVRMYPLLAEQDIISIIESRPPETQEKLTLAFLERLLNRRLLPGEDLCVLLRKQCSKPLLDMLVAARLIPCTEELPSRKQTVA